MRSQGRIVVQRTGVGAPFDVRIEAATVTVQNPFSGHSSFRAFGGTTIDEPTRVPRTDFRLALVYGFGDAMVIRRQRN